MPENVLFEFVGGPHDGLVVEGPIGGPNVNTAESLLRQSDGGKPGAEVWLPTPYAVAMLNHYDMETIEHLSFSGYLFPGHSYQIIVRRRSGSKLMIRALHLGASD